MRSFHDTKKIVAINEEEYEVLIPIEVSDWYGIGRGINIHIGKLRFRKVDKYASVAKSGKAPDF